MALPTELFEQFQDYLNKEQELREQIRGIVRDIDGSSKKAALQLQVIHTSIENVMAGCTSAREQFELCRENYQKLAELIPAGQYYRYNDNWTFLTQKLVSLIALTIFLEAGFLVERDTAAEILGLKSSQKDGFHLDIEDYLNGILQMASELSRFATNAVTMGDYSRPLQISRFLADLNGGFRLLNLKNDSLRKRFDGLKYDVKKIEEIVYDLSIRGLLPQTGSNPAPAQTAE